MNFLRRFVVCTISFSARRHRANVLDCFCAPFLSRRQWFSSLSSGGIVLQLLIIAGMTHRKLLRD
jgi:hypothetical protein